MTGKLFTGALVGALVLFMSGFIWYGLLPFADASFAQLPNEPAIVQTLQSSNLESGTYIYPKMIRDGGPTSMDEWMALHEKGPLFEVRYHKEGAAPGGFGMMGTGFVHFLIVALIAAGMLRMALPVLPTYGKRVIFVMMLGIFAAVLVQPSGPIWFYYPWDRAISDIFYTAVSWLLAGLAMGGIIKPTHTAAPVQPVDRREAVTA
jgi:hypothetical protein